MNNSSNKPGPEPVPEPHSEPPEPERLPTFTLPPEDRIRRVCGVLDAVSDALSIDSITHSSHIERRALALDLANDELRAVMADLEGVAVDLEGGTP
ncbi:MAG: hypothetical protein JST22_03650 [Bacteroidetes bacterium]|nr:hypothetical protein [Bacteroidota bacterium]